MYIYLEQSVLLRGNYKLKSRNLVYNEEGEGRNLTFEVYRQVIHSLLSYYY
jgi:hypothetical protein